MKEFNRRRKFTVAKYNNTPPFNTKNTSVRFSTSDSCDLVNETGDHQIHVNDASNYEGLPMKLSDIKCMFSASEKPPSRLKSTESLRNKENEEQNQGKENIANEPLKLSVVPNHKPEIKEENFKNIPKHELMKRLLSDFKNYQKSKSSTLVNQSVNDERKTEPKVIKSNLETQTKSKLQIEKVKNYFSKPAVRFRNQIERNDIKNSHIIEKEIGDYAIEPAQKSCGLKNVEEIDDPNDLLNFKRFDNVSEERIPKECLILNRIKSQINTQSRERFRKTKNCSILNFIEGSQKPNKHDSVPNAIKRKPKISNLTCKENVSINFSRDICTIKEPQKLKNMESVSDVQTSTSSIDSRYKDSFQKQRSAQASINKLKERNSENYKILKEGLRKFPFDKQFPELNRKSKDETSEPYSYKDSSTSFYRDDSLVDTDDCDDEILISSEETPKNQVTSTETLEMSVSRHTEVTIPKSFVQQQVDKYNRLIGFKEMVTNKKAITETIKYNCRTNKNKARSKFQTNNEKDANCTLIESIKKKISVYSMNNYEKDEAWSEGEGYMTKVTFPKETRHAVTMAMNKKNDIRIIEDDEYVTLLASPSSISSGNTDTESKEQEEEEEGEEGEETETGEQTPQLLRGMFVACPKNLLCDRGLHDGACNINKRKSWPGMATRIVSDTTIDSLDCIPYYASS